MSNKFDIRILKKCKAFSCIKKDDKAKILETFSCELATYGSSQESNQIKSGKICNVLDYVAFLKSKAMF